MDMEKEKTPVSAHQEFNVRRVKRRKIAQQIVELSAEHNLSIEDFFRVLETAKQYAFEQKLSYDSSVSSEADSLTLAEGTNFDLSK